MDQAFSIEMLANRNISLAVSNPCCADTMLSIAVLSDAVQTTNLSYLSPILFHLAHIILPTIHSNNAAIAIPIHSLRQKFYEITYSFTLDGL